MAVAISVQFDRSEIDKIDPAASKGAILRALRKAGGTAQRDMRSEARKRIRKRKRISPKYIARAIALRKQGGGDIDKLEWEVALSGEAVPLVAYPHRQTREGVTVEVNRGTRTLIKSAFIATMKSGHTGVFKRRGPQRLPIDELLGSRPVDALLHEGEAEAVAARGAKSLTDTFARLLPLELDKQK